ncbi:MAG TPA: DUF1127 domain-containing protein [Xanthobacteraceae bacterium]|nr:DUF1127 domain-containing protein [Xanthobacteraceae bacterium]
MEEAMTSMSTDLMSGRQRRACLFRQVQHGLAERRARARLRSELMHLSDRTLQDIGISRHAARLEACKPFWMP